MAGWLAHALGLGRLGQGPWGAVAWCLDLALAAFCLEWLTAGPRVRRVCQALGHSLMRAWAGVGLLLVPLVASLALIDVAQVPKVHPLEQLPAAMRLSVPSFFGPLLFGLALRWARDAHTERRRLPQQEPQC